MRVVSPPPTIGTLQRQPDRVRTARNAGIALSQSAKGVRHRPFARVDLVRRDGVAVQVADGLHV